MIPMFLLLCYTDINHVYIEIITVISHNTWLTMSSLSELNEKMTKGQVS
jgi:hypothetical protein